MAQTLPTINTYVSDMLALERHILQPTQAQLKDDELKKYPQAQQVVQEIVATVERHIQELETHLNALGGHAGSPVKSGVSTVMGAFATAIDNVRKTEISKDLRDDYAALCLATVSYTMLHTTAQGLHNAATAQLAARFLQDYAQLVIRLNATVPTVVLAELRNVGVEVDPTLDQEAKQEEQRAWREAAHSSAGVS